jgi:uncharacterized membrane protein
MDISEFLAKLIGLYFLITGLLCIFRKHQIVSTAKELASSKSALAVSGEISLLFGLVIAIDHTIWEYSWRGLITVLGYLMILKGIIRFAFPEKVKKIVAKGIGEKMWIVAIIMILIGAYLTYCGFKQD